MQYKKTTTTTTNLYILVHKKGIVVWLLLLAAHLELCEIFRTHTNPKIFLIHRIQSEGMLVKRARDRLQQSVNILKCRRRIQNSFLPDKLAFKLGFFICLTLYILFREWWRQVSYVLEKGFPAWMFIVMSRIFFFKNLNFRI